MSMRDELLIRVLRGPAGSLVLEDIASYTVVVGRPTKMIKKLGPP